MKRLITVISFGLLLCFAASMVAAEGGDGVDKYSLWVGMSYKDTADYAKKVGEYNLLEKSDKALPEFMLNYLSQRESNVLRLNAHYVDYENMNGKITAVVGDQFRGDFEYRSLTRQLQQDLLENMSAREYLPETNSLSGKMLTHDLQDAGTDYNYRAQRFSPD